MKSNILNKLWETGIPMGKMITFSCESNITPEELRKYLCIRLVSQNQCQLSEIVKDIKRKSL